MILISGATGNIGRPLVAELAAKGVKVRALTRTPETARFPEGVEACDSAKPDFDGVTALVLNISGGSAALLEAARTAGVRRVVTVSALIVAEEEDPEEGSNAAIHRELEMAVEAAVPEWTHLRPGAFAANSLRWTPQLQAGDVVRGPYAQARTSPIHEADIAAVAVRALLGDDLLGQAPTLTGPEGLSFAEQVEIIGSVVSRPLRYEEISPDMAAQAMMAHGVRKEQVDSLLSYFADSIGKPVPITGEVERILGRPPRTFAQWVADNADAFRR
ncbi:NAD(P)H-binding protein [Nonomuraea sp. NPDC049129]|uniref:NAD(P)H-binding protein n=1 Tax=Nonomuraea sp. NPDC049129 TaxID=3155272 RepID=UPI0033E7379F